MCVCVGGEEHVVGMESFVTSMRFFYFEVWELPCDDRLRCLRVPGV
jgi:hypothetical protein